MGNSRTVVALCAAGSHVVGGGGSAIGIILQGGGNASNLQSTFPSDATGNPAQGGTTNPTAWTASFFQTDPNNHAWALCVPN